MYADENNRLECSCIGARNKMVLKSALLAEQSDLADRLHDHTVLLDAAMKTSFSPETIKESIDDFKQDIKGIKEDIEFAKELFNKVSEIEICGD